MFVCVRGREVQRWWLVVVRGSGQKRKRTVQVGLHAVPEVPQPHSLFPPSHIHARMHVRMHTDTHSHTHALSDKGWGEGRRHIWRGFGRPGRRAVWAACRFPSLPTPPR